MYNQRHQIYKSQVYHPRDEQTSSRRSPSPTPSVRSRSSSVAPPRLSLPTNIEIRSQASSQLNNEHEAEEEEDEEPYVGGEPTEDGLLRVKYSAALKKIIPKKTQWHTVKPPIRDQVRKILLDNYGKTLDHIPGSVAGSDNGDAERVLKAIATNTDKKLQNMLIPGAIDSNMLNPKLAAETERLKMDFQEKLREFAIETLIEEKREAAFEEEKKELERLQEEKKRKIAELETYSLYRPKRTKARDYVQSLMLYPVESAFDP